MGAQASEGIGELAHIDQAKLFLPAKSILSSDNYSSHDGLFCCATEILCFGTAFRLSDEEFQIGNYLQNCFIFILKINLLYVKILLATK